MKKQKHLVFKLVKVLITVVAIVLGVTVFLGIGGMAGAYLSYRNHWDVTIFDRNDTGLLESAKALNNPDCGFYSMYGFAIGDNDESYYKQVAGKMYGDRHALSLIQINLRNYKDIPITDAGLENIRELFKALELLDKKYIIRFLYDWNGKAMEAEPEDIQTILGHIGQLGDILCDYQHIIFVMQGIFVGNCGEMHGSSHMSDESMLMLLNKLAEVTSENTFLSVRTPEHWRTITGIYEISELGTSVISRRLGLYNDGMMGTLLDTGTYGTASKTEAGPFNKWNREEELEFQSELCKLVPNGGEVIIENPVNDFWNAVQSLEAMHVTYLNRDYDQNVLNKWAGSVVTPEGVFNGMDGLTYVERHLGYRLFIESVAFDYEFWQDMLKVELKLKNAGFAPMYREPDKRLVILNKITGEMTVYPLEAELRTLAGGNESDKLLTISKEVSLAGLLAGEYEVYFLIEDKYNDCYIELANEQEMTEYGYLLGSFSVEELTNPLTGEKLEPGNSIGRALKNMADKRKEEGKVQ